MADELELQIDFSQIVEKLKKNKTFVMYGLLILVLLLSGWVRLLPSDNFDNQLSAMDTYWYYRHAEEVLDHGFIGTDINIVDGKEVYWDYKHNAPVGDNAPQEFYPYFIAYSYKYFGQYVTDDLITWDKYTPVIFGVLAVLFMFLLVRQLFGFTAGLAAAFVYSFAGSFMTRSTVGFADTDAAVAFFTLLVFYLFLKSWDEESFVVAGIGAVSLLIFSITWIGYTFVPLLMFLSIVGMFVFHSIFDFLTSQAVLTSFKKNWKKYAATSAMLFGGILLITFLVGSDTAAFWRAISGVQFKVDSDLGTTDTGVIRNVMLTVSEMNTPSTRDILARLHISLFFWIATFGSLVFFGLWDKIKKNLFHFLFFALWAGSTIYAATTANRFIQMAMVPLTVFAGIAIAELLSKTDKEKPVFSTGIIVFIIAVLFIVPNIGGGPPYVQTGYYIARQAGPSFDQNWLNLFEWMRTETEPDAIMASWWDPGHAVTALGERPAVADGSQDPLHVHDLGVIFTTTNESLALMLLDRYNVSYFFTSSDLLGKYGAISFLGTGNPQNYPQIGLSDSRQLSEGNCGNSINVDLKNSGEVTATIKEGFSTVGIKNVYFYSNDSLILSTNPANDTTDSGIYLSRDFNTLVFLSTGIENNMLTRLHLLDGFGLDHFEQVQNFGNVIKVYRVLYD